jgi:hypothetical protein
MMKKTGLVAITCLTLATAPLTAQSSLADQQRRCDDLRQRVEQTRRAYNEQRIRAEGERDRQDMVESAMRARGRTEAQIQANRTINRSISLWGGSVRSAQMAYESARENYDLQGCSSGGQSTYNYDVD